MGRTKRKKPWNPAKDPSPSIHDRRTTDLLRNAQVSPIEVDDPMEAGGKLIVMRSTRNDPLAALHARHHIDEAQYHGGRAFQRDFEIAERGPRAIDPSKEAVDGGLMPEPITEGQWKAANQLKVVFNKLGQDRSALIHDVLIGQKSMQMVTASRGLAGEYWERYFGKLFRECLDSLAEIYGFAMETR
jgi:hypothetical protein